MAVLKSDLASIRLQLRGGVCFAPACEIYGVAVRLSRPGAKTLWLLAPDGEVADGLTVDEAALFIHENGRDR